jgi:hypothetical protein
VEPVFLGDLLVLPHSGAECRVVVGAGSVRGSGEGAAGGEVRGEAVVGALPFGVPAPQRVEFVQLRALLVGEVVVPLSLAPVPGSDAVAVQLGSGGGRARDPQL